MYELLHWNWDLGNCELLKIFRIHKLLVISTPFSTIWPPTLKTREGTLTGTHRLFPLLSVTKLSYFWQH